MIFVCDVPAFVRFAEEQIRAHNADVKFVNITDINSLSELPDDVLSKSRLVGFTTGLIIPQSILEKIAFGSYNFHPGPPEYPGWDPIRFAIYEGARQFGVTAHAMTAQIDAGPIVGVKRFPVKENAVYADFQAGMVDALLHLFLELAKELGVSPRGPTVMDIEWSTKKFTRQRAIDLCQIPPDISEEELRKRIRAFGSGEVSLRPTIRIHGASFIYAPEEIFRA
jgi:methionyl-tRNA formyltransferase